MLQKFNYGGRNARQSFVYIYLFILIMGSHGYPTPWIVMRHFHVILCNYVITFYKPNTFPL